ncbi:MAG: hypothetical protein CMH78_06395 [Nitrospinae bacterium]|nr:hypothetical protein [Nitrospinota bacterium]
MCKKQYPNTEFYFDSIYSSYFPNEFADFVIPSEVIEHLDSPEFHLNYCNKVLKPNGFLCPSTPCVSIFLYPHNLLRLFHNPVKWYKSLFADKYWNEAVNWHTV